MPRRVDEAALRQQSPEWDGIANVRYPQIIRLLIKHGEMDVTINHYAGTSTSRW